MNEDIRFLLAVDKSGGSQRLAATPVRIEDGKVRSLGTGDHRLSDFQVSAYIAAADDSIGAEDRTYGWTRGYRDVFLVETERAEIMCKQLRALDRGMEKLEREFGFSHDFASYLARVASVLKIKQFGWNVGAQTGWHDQNTYQWRDATYIADWVRKEVN